MVRKRLRKTGSESSFDTGGLIFFIVIDVPDGRAPPMSSVKSHLSLTSSHFWTSMGTLKDRVPFDDSITISRPILNTARFIPIPYRPIPKLASGFAYALRPNRNACCFASSISIQLQLSCIWKTSALAVILTEKPKNGVSGLGFLADFAIAFLAPSMELSIKSKIQSAKEISLVIMKTKKSFVGSPVAIVIAISPPHIRFYNHYDPSPLK